MERRPPFARVFASLQMRRVFLGLTLLALLVGGLALRRYSWMETKHLRFQRDILNAFYWGTQTLAEGHRLRPADQSDSWRGLVRGYLSLYDRVEQESWEQNYYLDYPPLRLLAMSVWAKGVRSKFPGAEDGTPKYVEPLLIVNDVVEFLTAVGIFLLVRLGIRRSAGATDSGLLHRLPPAERGWVCGLVAASVAWLEPSLILDGHAWPQWDSWILPFYLFAALAALTQRWFWCGCLLALGGMFKGQLLFVTPFRDVQGPAALRHPLLYFLAALAKTLGTCRSGRCRSCCHDSAHYLALVASKPGGLGNRRRQRNSFRFRFLTFPPSLGMDRGTRGPDCLRRGSIWRRLICLAENRFPLRQ